MKDIETKNAEQGVATGGSRRPCKSERPDGRLGGARNMAVQFEKRQINEVFVALCGLQGFWLH